MRPTSSPLRTALAAAVVLSGCATAETVAPPSTETVTPAPTATVGEGEVATPSPTPSAVEPTGPPSTADCTITAPPEEGYPTVTAVTSDGLVEVDPRTLDESRCLLAGPLPDGRLLWNPTADRLLIGNELVGGATAPRTVPLTSTATWSRPTGTALIDAVEGHLRKIDASTGERTDVSFLDGHAWVTYYPSGTHLVTVGGSGGAANEIWFSTNTGEDARLLAEAEPGTVLSSPRVSEDGHVLTFLADHGDEVHVHRAFLQGEGISQGPAERDADTVLTLDASPEILLVSSWGWSVVASDGCGSPVQASDEFLAGYLAGVDVPLTPVGLLEDSTLVAIEHADGCDQPGTLVVLNGVEDSRTELLEGVAAAAIRQPVSDAPPPPTEGFSGFA